MGLSKVLSPVYVLILVVLLGTAHSLPNDQRPSQVQSPNCRTIKHVQDQCAFYHKFCNDEDDGVLSYLGLYYCHLAGAKPFAMILILAWMIVLFLSLGIVAGEFFAVNLGFIAHGLNLSDTLAGVTLLAVGNGAPDIFSTMAAMKKSSQALALGELIGAATFITSVVVGSMAFVRRFEVAKLPLIRDTIFLAATISFVIYVMTDGHLKLWHCIAMLIFYLVYVFVVAGWHWWLSRNRRGDANNTNQAQNLSREGGDFAQHEDEVRPLLAERDTEPPAPQRSEANVTKLRQEPRQHRTYQSWDEAGWYEPSPQVVDHRFASPSSLAALHHHRTKMRKHPSQRRQEELLDPTEHGDCLEGQTTCGQSENDGQCDRPHSLRASICSSFRYFVDVLLPGILGKDGKSKLHVFISVMAAPICLLMKLTVPVVDDESEKVNNTEAPADEKRWHRWLLIVQTFLGPQFVLAVVAIQLSLNLRDIFISSMVVLGCSLLFCGVVFLTSTTVKRPRWARFLCIPGFVVSICWISIIADEIVSVLKAVGVFCNIPEAILGITLFAIGNSMDDLAANISMARQQHPVMAVTACFGGPLLNILLGVSLSGILVFAKQSIETHHLTPINLHSSRDLFITSGSLLVNQAVLLLMMIWKQWTMTKLVGSVLIIVWLAGTVTNVGLEISSG